jgi:hypothetical protein
VKTWLDDDEYVNVLLAEVNVNIPGYDAGVVLAPSVPDTVMFPPKALMVVLPEYVFAFDNVSVPAPDFCSAPVPDTTPA